jgi:hypothetical protein
MAHLRGVSMVLDPLFRGVSERTDKDERQCVKARTGWLARGFVAELNSCKQGIMRYL